MAETIHLPSRRGPTPAPAKTRNMRGNRKGKALAEEPTNLSVAAVEPIGVEDEVLTEIGQREFERIVRLQQSLGDMAWVTEADWASLVVYARAWERWVITVGESRRWMETMAWATVYEDDKGFHASPVMQMEMRSERALMQAAAGCALVPNVGFAQDVHRDPGVVLALEVKSTPVSYPRSDYEFFYAGAL